MLTPGGAPMWNDVRHWETTLSQAGELQARTITLYGQDVRRFLTWLVWRLRERTAHREPIEQVAQQQSADPRPPAEREVESSDADLTALLSAVTSRDAQAYRAYLLAQGRGRSAVNRALTSLRLFFAMRDDGAGAHHSSPFDAVSCVPRPPRAG